MTWDTQFTVGPQDVTLNVNIGSHVERGATHEPDYAVAYVTEAAFADPGEDADVEAFVAEWEEELDRMAYNWILERNQR